jgi:hypothetical protein
LGNTVKPVLLVPVPAAELVTTVAKPAEAQAGTVKRSVLALVSLKSIFALLKLKLVSPARLIPVAVTSAPGIALAGVNSMSSGAVAVVPNTTNTAWLLALPPGVVTVKGPVVAPGGTTTVIVVSLTITEEISDLPSETLMALEKPVPANVTVVPGRPLAGLKLMEVGGVGGVSSFLQPASHRLPATALALV